MATTTSSSSQDQAPTPTTSRSDPSDDKKPRGAAHRRAREVSSRYMMPTTMLKSPVSTSSSSSSSNLPPPPLPPPIPTKKHRIHPSHGQTLARRSPAPPSNATTDSDGEGGSCFGDENRPDPGLLSRSLETPTMVLRGKAAQGTAQKKRAVVRLFRENGEDQRITRPGTPVAAAAQSSTPRSVLASRSQERRSDRELRIGRIEVSSEVSSDREDDSRSVGSCIEASSSVEFPQAEGGWCDSPPVRAQSGRSRVSSECRSSMPEMDQLPTRCSTDARPSRLDRVPTRCSTDMRVGRLDSMDGSLHRGTPSICHRSLNSAWSNCPPHTTSNQGRTTLKPMASPRASMNAIQDMEARKVRRALNRNEDAHTLRMLENRYLQWRFVNAKAQVATKARRITAERSLYNLSVKLLEVRNSVVNKKIELAQLHQMKDLSSMLEIEMPYLEDWTNLEADHSDSLSGTIRAVQDASLRLPLIGNVKMDLTELAKVLTSAKDVMERLFCHTDKFMQRADGVDNVISDLASVVCKERALIEECGNLLSEVQRLQVTECSLRGWLMQLKRGLP